MLKQTLAASLLLASAWSAHAQAGDPTFNGLLARATCYVRNITMCRSASCEQVARNCQGDLCGTFNLFLNTREYSFLGEAKPLQITDISAAEVGKPLWVKFQLPTKEDVGVGKLTMKPERLGGYVTSVTVLAGAAGDPSGRSFTLVNYDCEQVAAEP